MDENLSEDELVLRKCAAHAAEVLEAGWIKGSLSDRYGTRYCMLGAIERTALSREGAFLIEERARRLIGECSITRWNDAPERTQQEVVGMMRRVAAGEGARPPEEKPEE